MENITIKRMKFGSYTRLVTLMWLGMGMVFGLLLFIISLFGGSVYANLGSIELTGITAGVINLFLCPVLFIIFGLFIALISFLPFKLILKVLKQITLSIDFESTISKTNIEEKADYDDTVSLD